ncbi:MAG: hypothetical protein ACO3MV_02270 [Flavobacteriales bacterium]
MVALMGICKTVYFQTVIEPCLRQTFDVQGGIQNQFLSINDQSTVAVANNQGLLIFDGASWIVEELPNGTQSKSVYASKNGIYCGGQGFLGKFQRDSVTNRWLDFTPIIKNESGAFDEVWRLFGVGEPDSLRVILATSEFVGEISAKGNYREWIKGPLVNSVQTEHGIAVQTKDQLILFDDHGNIKQTWPFENHRLEALIWQNDNDPLILTHQSGIFHFKNGTWRTFQGKLHAKLVKARVNCVERFDTHWFIGTSENGILLTENFVEFQVAHDIESGLKSNTVLDIKSDGFGNYWVGLEGGIELLRYAWPHRIPNQLSHLDIVGYSSLHLTNGSIYWGTSQGVLFQKDSLSRPIEIPNLKGPIWALNQFEGQTWIAHPDGAGILDGTNYTPVISGLGCWNIWNEDQSPYWYVGTYEGIIQLHRSKAKWVVDGKLNGFDESTRFLAKSAEGFWWASHPYRGAFRFKIEAETLKVIQLESFDEHDGFPAPLQVNLCNVEDEILFATQKGFYRFNRSLHRMQPDTSRLTSWIHPEGSFQRIFQDPKQGLWVFEGDEVSHIPTGGAAMLSNQMVGIAPMQKSRPISPFESIEFTPSGQACIPVETGFVYLNSESMLSRDSAPALSIKSIAQFISFNDKKELIEGEPLEAGIYAFEYQLEGFNSNWSGIQQYQWRIKEVSDQWSKPNASPIITLSGIEPGNHQIQFRTFIHENLTGPILTTDLTIAPFWHQRASTRLAILLLFILAAGLWVRQNRLKLKAKNEQNREAEQRSRREAEQRMQASILESEHALQKEREFAQQQQLASRNQELASVTMNLVQKSQLVQSIENQLIKLKPDANSAQKKQIDELIDVIRNGGKLDEAWEQFTDQFDQVHVEFQQRITLRYPNLTKNDLKLCTYLRMNLSSKEMASLMYVSVRAIEVSRSRLRKRLDLDAGQNLSQFIQSI